MVISTSQRSVSVCVFTCHGGFHWSSRMPTLDSRQSCWIPLGFTAKCHVSPVVPEDTSNSTLSSSSTLPSRVEARAFRSLIIGSLQVHWTKRDSLVQAKRTRVEKPSLSLGAV